MMMRSLPSFPTVSGAVRVLPLRSFHRAKRSPLRMMISAPGRHGFVTVFLNTVPMLHLPFLFALTLLGFVSLAPLGHRVLTVGERFAGRAECLDQLEEVW